MKIDDTVIYHDARGGSHPATVTRVEGAGPSGYKLLDVTYPGGTATDVPHMKDWDGEDFWALPGEDVSTPEWPDPAPDPAPLVADFTAFDEP